MVEIRISANHSGGDRGKLSHFDLFKNSYVLETWLGKAVFVCHAHYDIFTFSTQDNHRQYDEVANDGRMAILTFAVKTLL